MGEGPGHMQWTGRKTHGEGKHTVRGDGDKEVARIGGVKRSPWPQWGSSGQHGGPSPGLKDRRDLSLPSVFTGQLKRMHTGTHRSCGTGSNDI